MYAVIIPMTDTESKTIIKKDFSDIARSFGNKPIQQLQQAGISISKVKPVLTPVTRISEVSGIERTMELQISPEQEAAYHSGTNIQHAFPNLTPEQREFYKTGVTDEEWNSLFPEED